MAIITTIKGSAIDYSKYNIFPDQFESEKKKSQDDWIKTSMDYFFNVAQAQYVKAKDTYLRNYNLVKGIIDARDFYIRGENPEVDSFVDDLTRDVDLPNYVKHYSILSAPLNELIGELSNRPDSSRVKAFDDESKNEELQFKTEITQQFILQEAQKLIMAQAAMRGEDLSQDPQQMQQLTMQQVQEYLTDYTSMAEKWGNHVLEAVKMNFNMKEISEDCFRDMLISGREYYHIYEDNSKLGFGIENLNPKNVWVLTSPDKKYVKDAYAAGTIHVMELSEIIDRFPNLGQDEIKHLKLQSKQANAIMSPRESNYGKNISGWDSIKYDTYNPLIERERAMVESQLRDNNDDIGDWFGLSSNIGTFGYKYVVTQAYWKSKKKIGKVTFLDENQQEQTALVDENYKDMPNQIGKVEWTWINQWYKGYKIGSDVYNVEEYHLLDYCPILGVLFEIKNIETSKSFIDLIKPYQIIFNVAMNQLWNLMEKEKGKVQIMSLRHIPTPKDGDGQDAIQVWEEDIKSRGTVFVDDSPENTKGASSFNQYTALDLTRTQEIQSRYELCIQIKNLAWELVGTSKERLGSSAASSTATAVNQSVSASYSQTEPYFAQHEYVLNNVYQAALDASQYIETQKPTSTISYINTQGEEGFISVNSEDIKLKDLQVFVTSRKKDQQIFQQLQALAQPMLQNGATPYEVAVMYTTDSLRQLRKVMKDQKDKAEAAMQQKQQMEQDTQQAQQQQFEYEQQAHQQEVADQRSFEHGENELNRLNKIETTLITAMAMAKEDPREAVDAVATQNAEIQRVKVQSDTDTKMRQIELQEQQSLAELRLAYEKLQTEKQKMINDMAIAKENNKAKIKIAKSKPKPKAPVK
jgi:hypothetical protein